MSTEISSAISKLNFVFLSRKLKETDVIKDHLLFPQSESEENELVKNSLFSFLKKELKGCKIRPNTNSFSIRLDSDQMVKGFAVEEIFNDSKWVNWFDANHNQLYRDIRSHRHQMQNIYTCRTEVINGQRFLYVPFRKERIENYASRTILDLVQQITNAVNSHNHLSNLHTRVVDLMEKEIARREEERQKKLQQALERYQASINQNLYKSATQLQSSSEPVDRLFASKFIAWAEENNVAPRFIPSITAKEIVPERLKVMVLAPTGSEEDGWIVLPPFETPDIPEGYEFQGWGDVTKVDYQHARSKNGESPIVVLDYIHAGINMEQWSHLLPENTQMIHEATLRLQAEALHEVEPWLEEERERFERTQREQERTQAEAAERLQQLTSSLSQQISQSPRPDADSEEREDRRRRRDQPQPERESGTPNTDLMSSIRAQFMSSQPESSDIERADGLYINYRALPIERYAVVEDGVTKGFASAFAAMSYLDVSEGEHDFHNYHEPSEVAETHEY